MNRSYRLLITLQTRLTAAIGCSRLTAHPRFNHSLMSWVARSLRPAYRSLHRTRRPRPNLRRETDEVSGRGRRPAHPCTPLVLTNVRFRGKADIDQPGPLTNLDL
jgi:hypothetical protein